MPPTPRSKCKLADCPNPPHVFPNGARHTYCSEHLKLRNTKQRNGLEGMTGTMKRVLIYLRDADAFVPLAYPLAHGTTIKKLIERDWIIEDHGSYAITGRGLKALKVYEPRRQRRDGVCPECGTRPRHVRSSGKKDAYCKECLDAINARRRKLGLKMGRLNRTCSHCHKKPRYQYPGGGYSTYCKGCARKLRRRNNRKQQKRILESVRAGGPVPMCMKCKVQPRHVFPNCVAKYCFECNREVQRKARAKRKAERVNAS